MQQYMRPVEDTLKMTKDRLDTAEKERDRALDELHEMKKMAQEANMRLSETMSTRKAADIYTTNETLSKELKVKEKNIESLKVEFAKAKKELEIKLVEKDASLDELKGTLSNAKSSEAHAMSLYSESKKKLQELELEVEKRKESEKKMFDSFAAQTKQLEQTMIVFEESKLEINSLREKLKKLESRDLNAPKSALVGTNETVDFLNSELQLAKEKLASSQENEKESLLKVRSLLEEVSFLKNELKLVTGAEMNNQKALDDLALALKEVALEASQAKEKLISTEAELEVKKAESEELKLKLKNIEDSYKVQLDELKKEADLHKNTAERLRLEAEESLLAWSEKETRFVDCIKRAEEERDSAQQEHGAMLELLKEAENTSRAAKDETLKLRDILKQAINEANVAKEASGIARAENARLQDALHAKEGALNFICRENEDLKMNEAANIESMKELKKLLSESSSKESKLEETQEGRKLKADNSLDKENKDGNGTGKKLFESFSINVKDVKIPFKHKVADENAHKVAHENAKLSNKLKPEDEESIKVDPLRGSIFEVSSPGSASHHRKNSSISFSDDGKTIIPDDLDNLEGTHLDDPDGDRNTRKKKALIRRFGDILLMRRTPHRKEPSVE